MPVKVDRILHSKRRTIALVIEHDSSVTVRAPLRMSARAIRDFVEKHAEWIEKKQYEMNSKVPEPIKQYHPGENFLFLGREYSLEIVQSQHKKLILDDHFKLTESARENAELVFHNWYRNQALQIITERVKYFSDQYDFHYAKIRITSARTRWGSCSSKGTLSFSWRLILTPIETVDYVVIHELAHTVHQNHSKRFWALVEKIMPDYKELRKRLRQHGQQALT
ncbi:MAG: SprT family zinc-dependent metalloprotease [Chloroflexota bacterium]